VNACRLVDVGRRPCEVPEHQLAEVEGAVPAADLGLHQQRVRAELEQLALARAENDRVGGRTAAVLGRILRVEVASASQVLDEPSARGVDVQEPHLAVAVVVEAVHDTRRDEHERPGRCDELLQLRAENERDLAREHVEGIGVVQVHVRLRAALSGCMPCPREIEQLVVGEDPQLALRRVADRFRLVDR